MGDEERGAVLDVLQLTSAVLLPPTASLLPTGGTWGARSLREDDIWSRIIGLGRRACVGTLAGGLVHEINNPATFVSLAGGQIEKMVAQGSRSPSNDLAKVPDLTKGIREAVEEVRDLSAAFRLLASGTDNPTVVIVDIERVFAAAGKLTKATHRHDVVIEYDIQPLPACPGRYLRLGPAVVGILANARASAPQVRRRRVRQGPEVRRRARGVFPRAVSRVPL